MPLWTYPAPKATVRLSPSGVYPIGKFGDVFVAGAGILLDTSWHDVAVRHVSLGIQTGCWGLYGREEMADWALMVPVLATLRYEIPLSYNLVFLPGISMGMTYTYGRYTDNYLEKVNRAAFHLAYGAGLMLEYRLNHDFGLVFGADFVLLYEQEGPMFFAHGRIGAYWRIR